MSVKRYYRAIKNGRLTDMRKSLAWMYGYSKKHFWAVVLYTVLGLSGVLISLFSNLVSRDLIDIITGHKTGELIKTFVLMVSIQLLTTGISSLSHYFSVSLSMRVENSLKEEMFSRILQTDWEDLTQYHSGDITSRWNGDSMAVANGILTYLPNIITSLFKFGSAFYMVAKFDWTFTVFALLSTPITLIASRRNLKRMQKTGMGTLRANSQLNGFVQETFSNVQTVKAFDMLSLYKNKLKECLSQLTSARKYSEKFSIVNTIITTCVALLVSYSTYGWGIYRVWSGAISYGSMTMFLSLSGSLTSSLQTMLNLVPNTIALTNSINRLREIIDLPKEDYSQSEEVKAFASENATSGIGLCVRNATFAYRNGTEVFQNVSFEAHPHEIIALVGPSGEGKTTMLRLILAIIRAQEGAGYVCSGNVSPESSDLCIPVTASTRQLFAYVPQGNTMFSGTIAENMRNVKEDATDEEIIEALKIACAWDFVDRLPDGINSMLQEHGGGLSEGQSQRLSIARAVLRRSPILLLDEATSALDIWTEKKVLSNIMADSYPRTTIVTTHRPSVLTVCNRVYAIRNLGCDLMGKEEIEEMTK